MARRWTPAVARDARRSRLEPQDVEVLQRAVEPYYQVLKDSKTLSPKQRSELILLGNVRMVAYEQRRLQPILERNLKLLPHALQLRVVTEWFGRNDLRTRAAMRAYQVASPVFPRLEEAFQIAATRNVYRMILGQERLRFGVDVPLPPPAHPLLRQDQPAEDQDRYSEGDFFPYDLQTLEDPALWSEWQHHDRSFGQGERTGVDNWLRLPERLNYVVNVFRSRQQLCALYERPSATPAPPRPEPPVLGPVRAQPLDGRIANCWTRSPRMQQAASGASRDQRRRHPAARRVPRPPAARRPSRRACHRCRQRQGAGLRRR